MNQLKAKEKEDRKKIKNKLMGISAILSLIFIMLLILVAVLWNYEVGRNNYVTPNSYSFLGNILTTTSVYSDISLVVEEKDNSIYAITLKNNELVSEKILCSNIDYSEINDFSVVLGTYDSDKNKDFVYISNKVEGGYTYKFYSIDDKGNITELGLKDIILNTKKASVSLTKVGDKYEYNVPIFYYDGYKIKAEVGEYKLAEKADVKRTISKTSKISIDGNYKAIPRKYSISNEVSEYVQNVNSYLKSMNKKQEIKVDLDGDKQVEYIISFYENGKTNVNLFDNSANFIVNLNECNGEKEIYKMIEIADIDNDGIMEIVTIKDDSVEVHKYNRGFYY